MRLLLLLCFCFVKYVNSSKLPSQYEASCYDGCKCNATTVECRDRHLDSTVFSKILPKVYPNLDTISITGNDFGLMSMDNIFGENERHMKVTFLDLSDNGIRSFYADTFFGVPKVEYLYLRNNELESVGEKPLNYLPNLRLLDLSAGFGDHINPRKRAEILKNLLDSDHHFKRLEEIIISNNEFQKLDPSIFCHIEGLTRLILSGNQLESFPIKKRCLENLKVLDLKSNKLSTIPSTLWNNLESLDTLDISNNPLQCDCKLEELVKFANEDPTIFLNQQQTVCSSPSKLSGKNIFSIENENLCEKGSSFFHWFVLILIAGGFFVIYRHMRKTGRFPRLPDTFGYSQLKRNDESNPSPAFV